MSLADFAILALIAVCVFFAWRTWRRSGSCSCAGGCCGDCAACRTKSTCKKSVK